MKDHEEIVQKLLKLKWGVMYNDSCNLTFQSSYGDYKFQLEENKLRIYNSSKIKKYLKQFAVYEFDITIIIDKKNVYDVIHSKVFKDNCFYNVDKKIIKQLRSIFSTEGDDNG